MDSGDLGAGRGRSVSVRLENLTVSYRRHPAVHHVSGQFADGQATAIVGPNGAGKSTILKAMIGALRADAGRVDLGGLSPARIAYLPQAAQIDRSLPVSVLDTVLMGAWHRMGAFGAARSSDWRAAQLALDAVGLGEFAQRPVSALSAGQFQRVLFARIVVQDAPLILLDEPFTAIDARTTHDLLHLIERWQHEQRTVIAVLHDFTQVRQYFPHTLLLSREVVGWGPTAEVLTEANLQRASANVAHWHEQAPVCRVDDRMPGSAPTEKTR